MPTARTTVALGSLLALAGILFDTPSLIVPGAAIVALAAGATAWVEAAARRVRVAREPGPATVVEGDRYPLAVSIERGGAPLPGAELHDPFLERPLPLGRRPPARVREAIRLPRRGRRTLGPASLVVADPFGLRRREAKGSGASEVLVLPRTEPVRFTGPGGGGSGGGWRRRGAADGEGGEDGRREGSAPSADVDGLRPHREGVPASRIHWPTAARTGELFERRLVPGADASHAVVLDASRDPSEASLDRAVRAAASLCLSLAPEGGCQLRLPGESRHLQIGAGLQGWPRAHAALAVVAPGGSPGRTAPRTARDGITVWVDAGGAPPTPGELRAFAAEATHLVTASEVPGLRPMLTVAGCRGYPLGRGTVRRARAREAAA